ARFRTTPYQTLRLSRWNRSRGIERRIRIRVTVAPRFRNESEGYKTRSLREASRRHRRSRRCEASYRQMQQAAPKGPYSPKGAGRWPPPGPNWRCCAGRLAKRATTWQLSGFGAPQGKATRVSESGPGLIAGMPIPRHIAAYEDVKLEAKS